MNLYQHKKNHAISSFCSRYIFDLKILQYYWPRAFWHKSEEPDFIQIWNLCNNIAYSVNFHYRPHSERSNDEMNNKTLTKKLIQFRENDWKEGRTDGETLRLTPGIQKISVVTAFFHWNIYFTVLKQKLITNFSPDKRGRGREICKNERKTYCSKTIEFPNTWKILWKIMWISPPLFHVDVINAWSLNNSF